MRRELPAWDSIVHRFGSRSFAAGNVDCAKLLDDKREILRRKENLPAGSREEDSLDLPSLVAGGFTPVLHTEPLASDSGAACLSPATWVFPPACWTPPAPAPKLVRPADAP